MEFKLFSTLFELICLKWPLNTNYWNKKRKIQADGTVNLLQMVPGHRYGHQNNDMWQERDLAFKLKKPQVFVFVHFGSHLTLSQNKFSKQIKIWY